MSIILDQLIQQGISVENIKENEPMSKHTSFKAGGKADYFIKVYTKQEILTVLNIAQKNKIPFFILGNGTNLLVKEEGYHGIIMQIKLDHVVINEDTVIVESGVKNAILAEKLRKNSLTGFEFAAGIPGTIGGAIKMNAGAFGKEMKDIVEEVTYLDKAGILQTITNAACMFDYRYSRFFKENDIIISAKLKLQLGKQEEIMQTMQELLEQRKEKQPLEYPSAGSTFKRGKDYITAKLIDECGLKGYQIGGAQVSEKHAGFIINKANATATDILQLINWVKKVVQEKTGKDIQLEIEIIGG